MHFVSMTPFILLAGAIFATWIPPVRIGSRAYPAWLMLFVLAACIGWTSGVLDWSALVSLAIFTAIAHLYANTASVRWKQIALGTLTMLIALALALHKLPGFHNPVLFTDVRLMADAAPFTQYINFDKGAAGLVLLAYFCPKCQSRAAWSTMLRRALPIAIVTTIVVLGFAWAIGLVKFEPKLPAVTLPFLIVNLMFTCIAEEAFFRGVLQGKILVSNKAGEKHIYFAVVVSALLFGLAHAGGGVMYAAFATLAGAGYGAAYAKAKRIEASILAHFLLNAAHFIFFTYPR